jgi:hypothetical protein
MLKLRDTLQKFTIHRDHEVTDEQSTLDCRARRLEMHDEQNMLCTLRNLRTYTLGRWYGL